VSRSVTRRVGAVSSYLNGVLPLGEVNLLLPLLLGDQRSLVLGEPSANGAGLLGSEVEREVLLVLVEQTQLGALVGVDDGQDAGDRLAEVVAEKKNPNVSLVPLFSLFPSKRIPVVVFSPVSPYHAIRLSFGKKLKLNAHSGELGGSTASDLLDTKLVQLGLELVKLLREVILAFSPELTGLDLGRRLENQRKVSVSISPPYDKQHFATISILKVKNVPWWAASSRVVKVVDLMIEDSTAQFDVSLWD
jgi:hypothetical protein